MRTLSLGCATHRAARLRRSRNQDLTAECVHGRWWRSGCKGALPLACLQSHNINEMRQSGWLLP